MGRYGHWPLLTHPGAAVALNVGEASAVATVGAGVDMVIVLPTFWFVGSSDIAGTDGWVYTGFDESPDPPASVAETVG